MNINEEGVHIHMEYCSRPLYSFHIMVREVGITFKPPTSKLVMKIDPWANEGVQNYKEICEKFGLETINLDELPSPTHLHRRGIIFAHRDLDNVLKQEIPEDRSVFFPDLCHRDKYIWDTKW